MNHNLNRHNYTVKRQMFLRRRTHNLFLYYYGSQSFRFLHYAGAEKNLSPRGSRKNL